MRQSNKEIRDTKVILDLLNASHVRRLGTVSKDGYPMVKPLNFVHHGGKIYFHTAREGEKIDDIKRDNRVCFEVDLPIALVKSKGSPCASEYLYRSVIARGRAYVIEEQEERLAALRKLMEKYQPEGGYGGFPEEKLKVTGIVRIDIEQLTGKEDLGRDRLKDAALRALEEKAQLPLVLVRE